MKQAEYDTLCAGFLKTFAAVPSVLRDQIIVVIDGKPYTWESAFLEIRGKSAESEKILAELKKLQIIH